MLASVGWPDVAFALVPTIAALAAAYISNMNRKTLKTPSGTPIGRQVESVHHVALGNNYRLRAVTGELAVATPPQAKREEDETEFLEPDGDAS